MENLAQVLDVFARDARTQEVINHLQSNQPVKLQLSGLVGSSEAFVAATVFRQTNFNHIFILEDKDAAAYFQNDLTHLLEKKDIFYFPDSFKRPGHFDQLNTSNILLRTESVNQFIRGETRGEILVTYPEALFEKVVSRITLDQNTLHISINEPLDVDFIIDLLVTYGFERVDFVYEPGQFSIRGGIVDIFSFGNELPYRIELFDNEVESIRTFNPANQLSSKKIQQVTIIPNIQTHFTSEQKVDFFELLKDNTLVWVKDIQFVTDVLNNLQEKAATLLEVLDKETMEEQHPFRVAGDSLPFTPGARWLSYLDQMPLVELNNKAYFKAAAHIAYEVKPQPAFNKNFTLLIEAWQKNTEAGITNVLFAENPRQIERFYQIFEDLNEEVAFYPVPKALHAGFLDASLGLGIYTDHQIFDRYHKYHIKQAFSKSQAISLKALQELEPGDFVVHVDHGVGVFSGLEKIEVNGQLQEAVRLVYRDNDLLYVNINSLHKISKFSSKDGKPPKINKLGSDAWESLKRKTKKKVKDIAQELIALYAKRKAQPGHAFPPDNYLQTELEASFIYEDTPDQVKATNDIKQDMESEAPMDRLICGDVGFGKTEVAIRAAFKAVCDSKQVAVLVPTTILAMQHYRTFSDRLKEFPVTIDYINRFKSAKQKKETLEKVKEGKIDILIGTHSIIGKAVNFKDLGLMIVDEEQKFGVAAKEKLKSLKLNVDTLTLTATPIPRTLKFSLMGARDLSIINTPPPNRQPINTELHVFNDEMLRDAIYHEYYRGGQVFFIHNRVKDIQEVATMLKRLCPEVAVGVAHGQMEGKELEDHMLKFIDQEYDVLVSTNIIETGLDIPNANTIIINNAHHFGLSDLHQLRGRVGRSNKKAFCYLFTPPLSALTQDARKRLKTIERFADLGSGFNIAMQDMDIRGAGNLLGGEQSGFVAEIGFELYHKILDEAIQELKETRFKDLFKKQLAQQEEFVKDTTLDTDIEMLIPDNYVTNINERLSLYTELNNIKSEKGLLTFREKLEDRFGPIPKATDELIDAIRLQWAAKKLGFEKMLFKNNTLKCFFISNEKSAFYASGRFTRTLAYIQEHPQKCVLKQTPRYLILTFRKVGHMDQARFLLQDMLQFVSTSTATS